MSKSEHLQLNVDPSDIHSYSDYQKVWKRMAPVKVTMIEQNEKCEHELGEAFVYENHYDKPNGICSALHHVLQLYLWRAAVGFPSWERDDHGIYRIHCPARKGTVWELKRK